MNETSVFLANEIRSLTDEYNKNIDQDTEPIMAQIEDLLTKELEKDPSNNALLFQLIALEYYPPWCFLDRFDLYTAKILENDPISIEGLILRGHCHYLFGGGFPDDVAARLQAQRAHCHEKNALIQIALSLYYRDKKNKEAVMLCLERAMNFAPYFPKSYFDLGDYYWDCDRIKAKNYYTLGLKYAKVRTWGEYYVNLTDIDEFFNEYIIEAYIDKRTLERVMDLLLKG